MAACGLVKVPNTQAQDQKTDAKEVNLKLINPIQRLDLKNFDKLLDLSAPFFLQYLPLDRAEDPPEHHRVENWKNIVCSLKRVHAPLIWG